MGSLLRLAAGVSLAVLGPGHPAWGQSLVAEVEPPSLQAGDTFGASVAIDGRRLVVGSPFKGPKVRGRAYGFDAWTGVQTHSFAPADWEPHDAFGVWVAVEGDHALIAARSDDVALNGGGVYVYDLQQGALLHELAPPDLPALAAFGERISVDGGLAVIGSRGDDDLGFDAGAVYLFDVATGVQIRKLKASDGAAGDRFGQSVAISGQLLVAGSRADLTWPEQGAVYVFDVLTGQQRDKLVAPWGDEGDLFGMSVAIDGDRIVVGSPYDDTALEDGGAVYVFDAWSGQLLFDLHAPHPFVDDFFGGAVAVDGDYIAVGAERTDGAGESSGSVFVFDRDGHLRYEIVAPDAQEGDRFGRVLDLDAPRLVVGAPMADQVGEISGSAYVFCLGETLGQILCAPANLNSTGQSARIAARGSADSTCDYLELTASELPPERFGCFLVARQATFVPFVGGSQGNLCLGGAIGRYRQHLQSSGPHGGLFLDVDLDDMPAPMQERVLPGETWLFQAWYRDVNPQPTSNLTDAVRVVFD